MPPNVLLMTVHVALIKKHPALKSTSLTCELYQARGTVTLVSCRVFDCHSLNNDEFDKSQPLRELNSREGRRQS